jgi:hypothetical protein
LGSCGTTVWGSGKLKYGQVWKGKITLTHSNSDTWGSFNQTHVLLVCKECSMLGHTKKIVVFPLTLWKKNRVGSSAINFIFFLNFIFNASEYIANSNIIMRIFIELNKGFISCIHRTSVHMQNCPYLCTGLQIQRCVLYFWNKLDFFLRGSIKFLGSGLKFRVGQVSRNTTFFFCMAWVIRKANELSAQMS